MVGEPNETVTEDFRVYYVAGENRTLVTDDCSYALDHTLSCLTIDERNGQFISDGSMREGMYPRTVTATYTLNGETYTADAAVAVTIRSTEP